MSDTLKPSEVLIQQAKQERQRLLEQIEQGQKTIERSRKIIARIDEALAQLEHKR